MQDAWRAYHAGDFAKLSSWGCRPGWPGYNAANKAAMIYANYLEDDDAKLVIFRKSPRCEELQAAEPENANAWYIRPMRWGDTARGFRWRRHWLRSSAARSSSCWVVRSSWRRSTPTPHRVGHLAYRSDRQRWARWLGIDLWRQKDAGADLLVKALKLNRIPRSPVPRWPTAW